MIEIIKDIEQGSEEWFLLRKGSIGGSAISKATAGGAGKVRKKLMYELAGEVLTGVPAPGATFQHAERGTENEPEARELYAFATGLVIEEVALIRNTDVPHQHYSPDGLLDKSGMIEIKTRIPSVWIEAKEKGFFPLETKKQIQWGLYVSDRQYCHYIQFCPEMINAKIDPIIVESVPRDEKMIAELKAGAEEFLREMLLIVKKIRG